MTKGQLPIVVGVVVAVVAVIVIVASLLVYIAAFLFTIFGAGGVEVVNTLNTPYIVANMLATYNADGRPLLESLLEASVAKDPVVMAKISTQINELLKNYDFPYEVRLETGSLSTAFCDVRYSTKHKAVDISASCGTPVKAVCGGRLSTLGPGLTGDKVFGGKASGGSQGLQIEHNNKCDIPELRGYRSFYGCIDILAGPGDVEKDKIIGYVGTCGAEPGGCHLHFGITKSELDKSEDPKICDKLDTVLEQGTNILAKKGEIEGVEATASVPLLYKNNIEKLLVTTGER